ncbi:MAG: metallophosphoesterase family protein [bacterium]|jgi:diadenosine tetraphosphatase ApaH/serine/threonine PP2A family protein phosphatase|nr:metallophosphoesterase family protein [bacterium]
MRIAVLGDIHSNLPALEAVMKEIKNMSVDAVFFSGDAVGYGPWPGETIDILRENVTAGVLGNHDAGIVGKTDITDYYDAVRYVINWTINTLNNDQFGFLDRLKYIHSEEKHGSFLLSHGSPRMPERYDYIFNCKGINKLYEVKTYLKNINFIGHSHYMNLFVMTGAEKSVELNISQGEVDVKFPNPVICVCGSVGQPRDGDPRAGFVIYDTEKIKVSFHRVEYDIEKTVQKIKSLRLPNTYGERLRNGY